MEFNRLALILGDQLFPEHKKLEPDEHTIFFMAEDLGLCTHYQYHKHKLILFLAAMRHHAESIWQQFPIRYISLDQVEERKLSYEEKLLRIIREYNIPEVVCYSIEDHFFRTRIENFCEENNLRLVEKESPGFLTSHEEFRDYLSGVKKPFMHTFYQRQRKRMLLLMEQGNPVGGRWSFDEENRKKLPKGIFIPPRKEISRDTITNEVMQLVENLFPEHPGEVSNFNWAVNREEVLKLMHEFFKERFQQFGPYEDAIDQQKVFVFHSVLSPYINMGLVTAEEVVKGAIEVYEEENIHFPSVEGFIRQIIGWREFIRGVYHNFDEQMQGNFFGHNRKMKSCWYNGETGIPPVDDSIRKAVKHGYTHHIERLMILGNTMLLCEIHPDDVNRWFMEMYVDSADWVMVPNVYGMSQFADGGIFATKPYIAGSNYILKMSNYSKSGEWPEVMNGLYWRFIDRNREFLGKNPRMGMMVRSLDKMDPEKRNRIFKLAGEFIERTTSTQ